ncbi:MAG: hypothetical protein AABY22_21710, partial [Nanoarchaeota archaeon]
MVNFVKYALNRKYRTDINLKISNSDKDDFAPEGFVLNDFGENAIELTRKTKSTEKEQQQKISFKTDTTLVDYDKLVVVYKTYPLVYSGIIIRANEIVARGFELKIKGETTPRGKEALAIIEKFVERNGLKWEFTRQLSITTDIGGISFSELYKDAEDEWLIVLISSNSIDFKRDGRVIILLITEKTDKRYGEPLGYVWKESEGYGKETELEWERIIILTYNKKIDSDIDTTAL